MNLRAPRLRFFVGIALIAGGSAQVTPSSTVNTISTPVTLPPGITLAPTHAPFPAPNIPALPYGFSDIPASVVSCWDAHANYSTTSAFLYQQIESARQYSESVYPPGHVSLSAWINSYFNCSTTAIPTLTTLCDGWPRASTTSSNCQTREETYTFSFAATDYWYYPTWSTELDQLPSPTCTPASDFGPVCSKLRDAYSWRVSSLQAQPSATGSIATPGCSVLIPTPAGATPKCHLEGGSWEASYWPSPTPSLCSTGGTNITATPTLHAQAVTAIVSGLTMTSPSIYHFVRNATLQTHAGRISGIGDPETIGEDAFAPSTTASLLTVRQLDSDILTMSRGCAGSNKRRYCTWRASAGYFSIADLATVRADEYCRPYGCYESETILQEEYTPTIALAMTDIVEQNRVFTDCVWTTPGARIRTAGPAAWRGSTMKEADWHKITATDGRAKETGAPVVKLR